MADMIFSPRRLRPGDIVRTEDRKRFQRVYSVSKDFVVLENDEKQNQRYFFSVYPIKLQDTDAMEALGFLVARTHSAIHKRCLRRYSIGRGDYRMLMYEMEMGYFRVKVLNASEYQKESEVPAKTFYYLNEVQQYFYERTGGQELYLEIPESLDFELETVHYWDNEGRSVVV